MPYISVFAVAVLFAFIQLTAQNLLLDYASSGFQLYLISFLISVVLSALGYAVISRLLSKLLIYVAGIQHYDYRKTLDESVAVISHSRDERDAASRILHSISQQVKVSAASVFVVNKAGFSMKAFFGVNASNYRHVFHYESLLVRWLTYQKRPMFKTELLAEYDPHLMTRTEIADIQQLYEAVDRLGLHVAVPVFINEVLTAILLVGKPVSKLRFSADDLEFFGRVGRQIVINTRHISLRTKVKERFKQLHLLNKITRVVNSGSDINVVLNMLNKLFAESLGLSRSILLMLNDEVFQAKSLYGLDNKFLSIRIRGSLLKLEKLLRGYRYVMLEKKHRRFLSLFTEMDLQDGIVVPLRMHGMLVGLIVMDNAPDRVSLSAHDEELLDIFSRQTEMAIEHFSVSVERDIREDQMFTFQEEADGLRSYTESVLFNVSNAVIATDNFERMTVFNKAAEEFFGCSSADMLGRNINVILKDVPLSFGNLDFSRNEPFSFEGVINIEAGSVPIKGNFIVLRSQGKVRGKLLVLSDVSQIKSLENQLVNSDRLSSIGTMAASMLHELRNPITSLKMFSEVMSQKYADPDFWESCGVIVTEEIERLDLLVNNYLGFSKNQDIIISEVNCRKLVSKVLRLLSVKLNHNKICVATSIPDNLNILGDEQALHQVLLNLLINSEQAFLAEQENKLISIRAFCKDQVITLCITDNGRGISECDQKKLFKPFFTTKQEGTGLGLYISAKIVSEMNGKLRVKSQLGFGTEFSIELPIPVQQLIHA